MKNTARIIACLLLVLSCSKPATETATQNRITKEIDSYVQETIARLKVPGITIAITRNDTVLYTRAFGYTNVESQTPMKPEHVFHWASVSKTFVCTAIMQLWEQKKIDLDEKLIAYLPYFRQKDAAYKDITIRQMLNHTSGIGDVDDYEWNMPRYDSTALEDFIRSTANDEMRFAPGKDMAYSNTAYEALGDVIAKVSGMSFETYVRKNIFDPLDMPVSSFLYPEIPDSLKVTGHVWGGKSLVSQHYPYNRKHGPSSTLNSNVIEMTHYAFAHLHRGEYNGKRILAESTYDLLWTNTIDIPGKPEIGLAWWLNKRHGLKTVSHSGGDTGFRSFFMLVPEKNISVMLVCNSEIIRTNELANGILDILLNREPDPVKRHIGFSFAEVLLTEGRDAAIAFHDRTKADSIQRANYIWEENEGAFAWAGYLFLEETMYPEAIEIFRFNVTQFPQSGWAHSHLATGYTRAGDLKSAQASFKKAIELLPDEQYFKDELKKVGG